MCCSARSHANKCQACIITVCFFAHVKILMNINLLCKYDTALKFRYLLQMKIIESDQ